MTLGDIGDIMRKCAVTDCLEKPKCTASVLPQRQCYGIEVST